MWTTLNFEGRSKTKEQGGYICKGTLDIECERHWSFSLGATLGEGQKIKKTIFLVSGIFLGKADSVILLGYEYAINPENKKKNRSSHFWENRNFTFFSHVNYP